ncbi:hypothetical protein L228DRAFT_285643 [Xylona heveae TC161]|uniref:Uncharacterized protein n=1 Tax=Xylona heveae (strain CBS 132557 / TC161) TaxID=1328760 RepID=A0A164ZYJ1_XYLHT|nr:hypothetical protein L228DRAFT_285643 [Xylona heveae TC161]KZF19704.1 hypothetical protein L228DRAFT_285643 [Xylona heveae TC161]
MPHHARPGSILYRALQAHGGTRSNGLILVADFLVPSLSSRCLSSQFRSWSSSPSSRYASTISPSVPSPVGTEAFNVILGGIVDLHGSKEGKRLYDIWCQESEGTISRANKPSRRLRAETDEKSWSNDENPLSSGTVPLRRGLESSSGNSKQNIRIGPPGSNALRPPDESLHDPEAWAALVDPFLPHTLRSNSSQEQLAEQVPQGSRQALVTILSLARRQYDIDILAHMGCNQGRWQAVLWIITKWVNRSAPGKELISREILRNAATLPQNQGLNELTASPTSMEARKVTARSQLRSFDGITEHDPAYIKVGKSKTYRDLLAEFWQSIGHFIIISGNQSEQEAQRILSFVRQILAHFHHVGVVSNSIYRYIPEAELPVLHKPPTLHLLSSRILASLSDASWRAREEEVLAEAKTVGAESNYKGYQLPSARYKLKVREIGPEVWMEFVLWSCVEDRLIGASAWLLKKMSGSEAIGGRAWAVVNWETIQRSVRDKTGHAKIDWARVEAGRDIATGSVEAYSRLPPVVDMGERTVSSEVVEAVIDGLVETAMTDNGTSPGSITATIENISLLQHLLERDGFGFSVDLWHMALLRVLDTEMKPFDLNMQLLESIISLVPVFCFKEHPPANLEPDHPDNLFELSAATIGLCDRALRSMIKSGQIQAATRLFRRLHSLTRDKQPETLAGELDGNNSTSDVDTTHPDAAGHDQVQRNTPLYQNQLSPSLLASFLDLITESKCFNLGRQLLLGDGKSEPVIPTALYSHEALTPALLRFAAATADSSLLAEVAKSLSPPLPDHFLRALLRCQVSLTNWPNAEELMDYCQHVHRVKWMAGDASILAEAVLQQQRLLTIAATPAQRTQQQISLHRAKSLLQKLLSEEYGPFKGAVNGRTSRDYTGIIDVLKTTGPPLEKLCPNLLSQHTQIKPWSNDSYATALPEGWSPVVPNLTSVRAIMRGALQERRQELFDAESPPDRAAKVGIMGLHLYDNDAEHHALFSPNQSPPSVEAASILDWGVDMYKNFGVSEADIDRELDGYMTASKAWAAASASATTA